ncbi:MAG: uroporphyrinogen decarboxylase family protein [candidate division WOR-3 bacterium]
MKDLLTPRERFGLLVMDEPQDRCPVFPLLTAAAARLTGANLRDYYTDGIVMARCQLQAQERFGTDFISLFSEVGIVAEALGSRFEYPEDELPVLSRPRWRELPDGSEPLAGIINPMRDGRLPVYWAAARCAYEARADTVPILAYIPAPFTTAQQLVDPETFLLGLVERPDDVKRLLEFVTRSVITFCRAMIDAGALPILVDPLASGSVISPEDYRQFALPYEQAVIRFLHRYDLDVILHICGDTTAPIELMADSGADLLSIDRIGLAEAIAKVGDRCRIIGNLDTTGLWLGTPQEVADDVGRMTAIGKACPKGFVAATGCEVPIETPAENIRAFVTAAREAGANHHFAKTG